MRVLHNKTYRDMTNEEIETFKKLAEETETSTPTDTDRISALESAVAELVIMQMGGTE